VLHSIDSSTERSQHGRRFAKSALALSVALLWVAPLGARAADLLVADRLSNSVYRYSDSGALLGTIIDHSPDFNQPTGIGISPDSSKLYVSSSQNNRVMRYDYDPATGAATNPAIFADASDGLEFPNDIQFSPDGGTIYVANLSGGVSRFRLDGESAGSKLEFSPPTGTGYFEASSMTFTSTGQLLAGVFIDPSGSGGGIAKSNATVSSFPEYLVSPTSSITGATGLMIHNDYLYVSGLFSTSVRRFQLSNGQIDASWAISGLGFPQDLAEAPDGNGFLVGVLGFSNGNGNISRYSFSGELIGILAAPSTGGFTEATAFVTVPTPRTGDFNFDGVVDAADYIVWRNASPTATLPNDESPGSVDPSDYDDWRANFGKLGLPAPPGAGAQLVPEPAGTMLLLLMMLVTSLRRDRS
jgi:DNA-binding beta-propeller fold protein YncE